MAKSKNSKKKNKKSERGGELGNSLWVDPAQVRFQHSRIRPYFSGCGRSVVETLESIRRKEILPSDLPPIQVRHNCFFTWNFCLLWLEMSLMIVSF